MKGPMKGQKSPAVAFGVSIVAAVALAVVYAEGGNVQLEGILLACAFGGIGVGIVLWAKRFMPTELETEERKPIASTEDKVREFTAAFEEGEETLARRSVLVRLGLAAFAALAGALVFPIRSLGPRPGKDFKSTPFAEGGLRLVDVEGVPIRPSDLLPDQVVTAWPEGHTDAADAPTLVIKLRDGQEFQPRDGREGWTPENVVAFSKLCTHTGCPVGLYQADIGQLLCPCHQSTFDVLDAARPIFGPAARSLPQLELQVNPEGHLVAPQDFSDPVGGGFFDRGRGE